MLLKKKLPHFTLLALAAILVSFYACREMKVKNAEVQHIRVETNKARDMLLSDFATQITYLKLESSSQCLFSSVDKLIINKFGIFILDKYNSRKVFHFGSDGHFIRSIGTAGQGSGEYILPSDFLINENSQQIEIIDNFSRNNYIFDFKGKFIKKINYKNYRITSFIHHNVDDYLIKLGDNKGLKYEGNHFIITNASMDRSKSQILPVVYDADLININPFSNSFNGRQFISYGFDDKIYEIINNSAYPRYVIDFGKKQLTDEELVKGDKYVISKLMSVSRAGYIYHLVYTGNEIYFNFLHNKKDYLFGFNSNTYNTILISSLKYNQEIKFSNQLISYNNGFFITKVEASVIFNKDALQKIDSTIPYGLFYNFDELQKNTKLNDNPCLIFFKTKI